MKILITQSNYIPWKGYFDSINMADEVIFYDHVQFTKRDWRNRNIIRTREGLSWLTIPVEVKGKFNQRICDTRISEKDWARKHWNTIVHNYSKASCFAEMKTEIESLYQGADQELLSDVNYHFIKGICRILGITTVFGYSQDMAFQEGKNEALIDICLQRGATEYLTGPAARSYLDLDMFKQHGINVTYLDYSGYPEYRQVYPGFEHGVSIIDLLFNEGRNAGSFMKTFNMHEDEIA